MNAVIYVVRLTFVFLATAVTTFLMNVALITIDPSHYSLAHPDQIALTCSTTHSARCSEARQGV